MSGASSSKLIAVGDNCLDVYLSKGRYAVGGNALNVAAQWQRQGLEARYFGRVGTDAEAALMLTGIENAGLSRSDVEVAAGATAVTLLLERNGDRRFLLEDLGVGLNYMPAPDHYAAMQAADWVHLGTNANPDLIRRMVQDGLGFSLDVSTAHDVLALEGVPLVFAAGPEDASVPVDPIFAALRERGARKIVLTCGRRGAYFDDGNARHHELARPIKVVDTCGAGDSFIAAFVVAHVFGKTQAPAALAIATSAAAQTCLYEGGFPQSLNPIPDWLLAHYGDVIAGAEI